MLAEGDCGKNSTDAAIRPATVKATVVKKPKTFWMRTREECILVLVLPPSLGVVVFSEACDVAVG